MAGGITVLKIMLLGRVRTSSHYVWNRAVITSEAVVCTDRAESICVVPPVMKPGKLSSKTQRVQTSRVPW